MNNARSDWSNSADVRTRPASGAPLPAVATPVLAILIVALLAAGIAGAAVHQRSSSAAATPDGYRVLVDGANHLRLAIPNTWQVAPTTDQLSAEIQKLTATNPQLATLAQPVVAALQKVQVGVLAVDLPSGTVVYTYGADDPSIRTFDQVSTTPLVTQLHSLGATLVQTSTVQLPVGRAKQVSSVVSIGSVTVAEVVDLFVVHGRYVVFALAVRASQPPTDLAHQIQKTLANP